jgi:hypothetical protein
MEYITIKYFDNYMSANLYLNKLKSADINCYLKNENSNTVLPLSLNALGGIHLCVANDDVEKANIILEEFNNN